MCKGCPFVIGKKYFVRTLSYHFTGKLKEKMGDFLMFEDSAWIADSGRFMQAIETGKMDEVEPINCDKHGVNKATIVDFMEVSWELPNKQL